MTLFLSREPEIIHYDSGDSLEAWEYHNTVELGVFPLGIHLWRNYTFFDWLLGILMTTGFLIKNDMSTRKEMNA